MYKFIGKAAFHVHSEIWIERQLLAKESRDQSRFDIWAMPYGDDRLDFLMSRLRRSYCLFQNIDTVFATPYENLSRLSYLNPLGLAIKDHET